MFFAAIFIFLIMIALVFATSLFSKKVGDIPTQKAEYNYTSKKFILTRAEHECYDALVEAVNGAYYVFPQVHISTLVDHKIKGQNWKAAFSHINGKSVDFVLCDKAYISAKLAIELDDISHVREDRKVRDIEVERILKDAGLPLLRIENHGSFSSVELRKSITDIALR